MEGQNALKYNGRESKIGLEMREEAKRGAVRFRGARSAAVGTFFFSCDHAHDPDTETPVDAIS